MKQKLLLGATIIALIFIVQACRKSDFFSKASVNFKVEDAKEWYYGAFKKQELYKQGLLGNVKTKLVNKKMPYWPKGIAKTVGSFQVVEMPYVGTNTLLEIIKPSTNKVEAKMQAESILKHVLFVRNSTGLVIPKLVHLVPDYAYLQKNNFDISFNSVLSLDKHFSGWLMIYSWQDELEKAIYLQNGKTKKTLLNVKKGTIVSQQSDVEGLSSNTFGQLVCMPDYEVSSWLSNCASNQSGDVPNPENCAITVFVSEGTNCFIEPNEDGEFDDWEEEDCITTGDPNCFCEMLGICDSPPGDGPQEDAPVVDQIEVDLSDSCLQNAVDQINVASSLGNSIGSILHETFTDWGQHDLYIKQSCIADTATDAQTTPSGGLIVITFNECALQNASQEYIAATLYHEILHAYFFAHDRLSGLNQHSDMANKYLTAMISTMMENFPTLSYADAEALAWGGLFETQAWKNLELADPNKAMDIKFANKKHRNGDWGTKCR